MRTILLALTLATGSLTAQAGPQDDMERFLAERGLVQRMGDAISRAGDTASHLVSTAMGAIGIPYRMGGNSAETGFDCSGFVRAMVKDTIGLLLPRRAEEQAAATEQIKKAELQPGDLVFFNTMRRSFSHVGIYVGDGKFIHSPRTGSHVRVESMNVSYWQSRFDGARRVLGSEQAKGAALFPRVTERDSPAPTAVRLGGSFGKPGADSAGAAADSPYNGESI